MVLQKLKRSRHTIITVLKDVTQCLIFVVMTTKTHLQKISSKYKLHEIIIANILIMILFHAQNLKKRKVRTSHVHLQQYFTPHEFERENFKSHLTWLFHKVHAPRTKFRRHVKLKSLPRSSTTLLMIPK